MADMTPKSPVRADHRFLHRLMHVMLGSKVEYRPSEFSRLSRVFLRLGGSWERVFRGGSPSDIVMLKRVIKKSFQHGYLTKKESWSADGK